MNTLYRLITATGIGLAVLAGASATATAATPADGPAAPTTTSAAAQFEMALAPSQTRQLPAGLAVPDATVTAEGIGVLAQGGFDRDHWWIKISKAEVIAIGANAVCRAVFRTAGGVVCPPIVAAVNWLVAQFPNAGGFWAELYTNGRVRAGTW
ncbi:hypothetical protein [Lentzea sp. NPDC060358]|uniref:hypothetical protein n=1 Tax=Lentzea sp. NPDC060358 TaxID=3347103 RepID=UPI003656DA23